MVLESLIKARNAERHPFYVLLLGLLYGATGLFFDLFVFGGKLPNLFVFITVFASIPLMYKMINMEGKKEKIYKKEMTILQEHAKALTAFVALFFGILISFTAGYMLLSPETAEHIFAFQHQDILSIHTNIGGRVVAPDFFHALLLNNLKVLFFSFIFSFFFGAGAIFILTWNASLIAAALGSFLRTWLSPGSSFSYALGTISYGFMGYLFHGLFEIVAYFIAGLAGGVISVAVIRHDLFHKNFLRIVNDALWLLALSVIFLVLGAVAEAYLSPLLFP